MEESEGYQCLARCEMWNNEGAGADGGSGGAGRRHSWQLADSDVRIEVIAA